MSSQAAGWLYEPLNSTAADTRGRPLSRTTRATMIILLSATIPVNHEVWIAGKEMNLAASDPVMLVAIAMLAWLLLRGALRLPLSPLFAAMMGAACLSFFVQVELTLASKGLVGVVVETAKLAMLWMHLFVIANLVQDRRDILLLLKSWTVAGTLVGLTGIYGSLAYQHLGIETGFNEWYRANGTFDNSNLFALHMTLAFLLTLLLRALDSQAGRWTLVAGALQAVGVFYSASRSALLALVVGMAVYWVLGASPRERFLAIALGLSGMFAVLLLPNRDAILASNPITARLSTTTVSVEAREADDRMYLWRRAWQGFSDSPLVGIGRGNFLYLNRTDPSRMGHAHNTYLGILCEMGLLGFGLYATLIAILLFRLGSAWLNPVSDSVFQAAGTLLTTLLVLGIFGMTHSIENYRGLWVFFAVSEGFLRYWAPGRPLGEAA